MMYCSGCGKALVPGQPVCANCGRPMMVTPPIPGLGLELQSYAAKLKTLGVVWIVWGVLSLAFGILAMGFADAMMAGRFGPWMNGPLGRHSHWAWLTPEILKFIWVIVIVRAGLALAAGWGLLHRAPWGRVVAIVSAIFSILKFPFGTALGIWTLVVLLGYRNTTLYEQLPEY